MCACKMWLFSVSLVWFCVLVTAFNIDSFNYASYYGPDSSMFGFSVAVHRESGNGWLIVGAPEDQSTVQPGVYRGGAVYKCPTDRDGNCQQIPFDTKDVNRDSEGHAMDNKTEQWFGATVSSSSSESGPIVACAPRYTWYPRGKTRRDPVGTCYVSNGAFNHFDEYSPCRTFQWGYHRQGSCQAGFSAAINHVGDRLFIGSPGSWYWQGQMYSVDAHAEFEFKPKFFASTYGGKGQVHQQSLETRPAVVATNEGMEKDDDSYMGYSTIVGDFKGNGEDSIAVGMPRGNNLRGKVLLFSWNLTEFSQLSGDQLGSYFGYALASSDVDGDGKVDLIIGAPMYTIQNNEGKYDVGRVYVVYQQNLKGKFATSSAIDGFNSKSRFGQAVASLADINQDGFGDFAVGAPYDGLNQRGAVYIYHGSSKGVRSKYSQVIYAEEVVLLPSAGLVTFGFSITGGLDLDGNAYPDMAVGAYLSSNAFFFRSRPVVRVEAEVRFLTPNKEVDIKMGNYNLRSGAKATLTQIDFCIKYSGNGIPHFIELDLQYILDSKKERNPRMGFVDNENQNILNDTIRIFKDRPETCKRKDVYVLSDIRDKLTLLVAEVQYWMREESSGFSIQRNPRSTLKPILDLNSPLSRNDSISVHKECGDDNICIPNLTLNVKPSVDKYLLGSNEHMFLEIQVSNTGEDSFETSLEVKYSDNVFYVKVQEEKVESHVLCNTHENNTLKCEIGNPIPRDKVVIFKIFWQPTYKRNMSPTYDFALSVNSTNQEASYTLADNKKNISVGIWSNSRLEVRGKPHPREVFFNSSLYTADISHQSTYTLPSERLPENVIGPQVIHTFYLRNEGPAAIEETEVFFAWPSYTLGGDDFLYLLEPPHFSSNGNIRCGAIPANYKGFDVEVSKKSIWERLNLNVEGEGQGGATSTTHSSTGGSTTHTEESFSTIYNSGGSRVQSSVGGGVAKNEESINKAVASSGDSSLVQKQRQDNNQQKISSSGSTIVGPNGQVTTTSAKSTGTSGGYTNVVYTNQTHYRNDSGVYVSSSGQMTSRGQGGGEGGQLGYGQSAHRTKIQYSSSGGDDSSEEQSSGGHLSGGQSSGGHLSGGQSSGGHSSGGQSSGGHSSAGQFSGGHSSGGQFSGGQSSSSNQNQGFIAGSKNQEQQIGDKKFVYRCLKRVNGVEEEVECGPNFSFPALNASWIQESSKIQLQCFEEVNGQWKHVDCDSQNQQFSGTGAGSASHQGGTGGETKVTITHKCREEVNGRWYDIECGPGGSLPDFNNSTYQSRSGGQLYPAGSTVRVTQDCYKTTNGVQHKVDCGVGAAATGTYTYQQSVGTQYGGTQGGTYQRGSFAEGAQSGGSSGYGSQYGQGATGTASGTQTAGEQRGSSGSYSREQSGSQFQGGVQHGGGTNSRERTGVNQGATQQQGSGTYDSNQGYGSQYGYHQQGSESRSQQGSTQTSVDAEYAKQQAAYQLRLAEYEKKRAEHERKIAQQERERLEIEQRRAHQGSSYNNQGSSHNSGSQGAGYSTDTQGSSYNSDTHGSSYNNQGNRNNQPHEDEEEYSYEEEDEDEKGKAIGNTNTDNYLANSNQGRRDPKTYGRYDESRSRDAAQATGLGAAALGNKFSVTTVDVGDLLGHTNGGGGGEVLVQGGAAGGGAGQDWRQEGHWSETRQIPPTYNNAVERDNVPTDKPTTRNRFYGRKKRQALDNHPSIIEIKDLIPCHSVQCVYMRCTVENLENAEEISIALRARINARVLRNVSSSEPLSFSSVMAARIHKLPYIGTPGDQTLYTHEVFSTVSRTESEIKPDVVPLWVVILSAVAGTVILLLIVLLLYKFGFFKRNRPSNRPERQPLNRNGYQPGDEAL